MVTNMTRPSQVLPKYDTHRRTVSVSLCCPATRMVVVEAISDHGNVSHRLAPVLALQASVVHRYTRPHRAGSEPPHMVGVDPGQVIRDGWSLESVEDVVDPLVLDYTLGICPAREAFNSVNTAFRVVVAAWDPSEDETRLAGIIADVKLDAIEAEALDDERRGARAVVVGEVGS